MRVNERYREKIVLEKVREGREEGPGLSH